MSSRIVQGVKRHEGGKYQVVRCWACKHVFAWGRYGRPRCPECPDRAGCDPIKNIDDSVWFTRKVAMQLARKMRDGHGV